MDRFYRRDAENAEKGKFLRRSVEAGIRERRNDSVGRSAVDSSQFLTKPNSHLLRTESHRRDAEGAEKN
jgi:hypothetical protein